MGKRFAVFSILSASVFSDMMNLTDEVTDLIPIVNGSLIVKLLGYLSNYRKTLMKNTKLFCLIIGLKTI